MLKKILAIGMACVLFCGCVAYVANLGNQAVYTANDAVVSCYQLGH